MTHCRCPLRNLIAATPSLINQYCSGLLAWLVSRSFPVPAFLFWSSICEWCWSLDLLSWDLCADTLTRGRMTLFHTSCQSQKRYLLIKINNTTTFSAFQFTVGTLQHITLRSDWLKDLTDVGPFPWNDTHKIPICHRKACLLTIYCSITNKRIQNPEMQTDKTKIMYIYF